MAVKIQSVASIFLVLLVQGGCGQSPQVHSKAADVAIGTVNLPGGWRRPEQAPSMDTSVGRAFRAPHEGTTLLVAIVNLLKASVSKSDHSAEILDCCFAIALDGSFDARRVAAREWDSAVPLPTDRFDTFLDTDGPAPFDYAGHRFYWRGGKSKYARASLSGEFVMLTGLNQRNSSLFRGPLGGAVYQDAYVDIYWTATGEKAVSASLMDTRSSFDVELAGDRAVVWDFDDSWGGRLWMAILPQRGGSKK